MQNGETSFDSEGGNFTNLNKIKGYYKLAVVGNPVAHSLSPVVWNKFAKQSEINLEYDKILADNNADFEAKVKWFFKSGGFALNITSPFKQQAYLVAKSATVLSGFCRAANFLRLNSDRQIIADTTDGAGLIADLQLHKNISLTDKRILILGSGFVWDSMLLDFITQNPAQIDILARNQERVKLLHERFAIGNYDRFINYDIIFNSSPNAIDNPLFSQINHVISKTVCYDLAYATTSTIFLNTMQGLNRWVVCYNGLGMLVEQAKIAFVKLFKVVPDSKIVLAQLTRGK